MRHAGHGACAIRQHQRINRDNPMPFAVNIASDAPTRGQAFTQSRLAVKAKLATDMNPRPQHDILREQPIAHAKHQPWMGDALFSI